MRGRKPDAKAIRRADDRAELTPARVIDGEPQPLAMPDEVAGDPAMADIWRSTVGTGIAYDERDVPFLTQYVFYQREAAELRSHVYGEDGRMILMVGKGQPDPETGEYLDHVPNPYIKMLHEATANALRLADQLGLTPLARARLGLTQAAGAAVTISIADQIDAVIARRK